jgi:hypothetical protein
MDTGLELTMASCELKAGTIEKVSLVEVHGCEYRKSRITSESGLSQRSNSCSPNGLPTILSGAITVAIIPILCQQGLDHGFSVCVLLRSMLDNGMASNH